MAHVFHYTACWTRPDLTTAYWAADFSDHLLRPEHEVKDHLTRALANGHPHFAGAKADEIVLDLALLSSSTDSTSATSGVQSTRGRMR